jgi:hypothetical protein
MAILLSLKIHKISGFKKVLENGHFKFALKRDILWGFWKIYSIQ